MAYFFWKGGGFGEEGERLRRKGTMSLRNYAFNIREGERGGGRGGGMDK